MINFNFRTEDSELEFTLTLDSEGKGLQFVELSPNQTIGTVNNIVRDSEFLRQEAERIFAEEYDSDFFSNVILNVYDSDFLFQVAGQFLDSDLLNPLVADQVLAITSSFVDSEFVDQQILSLIDSDYVEQVILGVADSEFIISTLDSEYISSILDSEYIGSIIVIDSDLIVNRVNQLIDSDLVTSSIDSDFVLSIYDSDFIRPIASEIINSIDLVSDSDLSRLFLFESDGNNPDPVLSDFTGNTIFIGQY